MRPFGTATKDHECADFFILVLEEQGDNIGRLVAAPFGFVQVDDFLIRCLREPGASIEIDRHPMIIIVDFGFDPDARHQAILRTQHFGRNRLQFIDRHRLGPFTVRTSVIRAVLPVEMADAFLASCVYLFRFVLNIDRIGFDVAIVVTDFHRVVEKA